MTAKISSPQISRLVLEWYDRNGRHLPWRKKGDARPDPYHVWLSEIMLQQTTVAAVIPYFGRFLDLWPNVMDLAEADLEAVLHAWQGLGYYARARNLHRCARQVTADLDGGFPASEDELLKLPGIGPYTAAAIAAIAFGARANVVDGNIERIMARLYRIDDPLPAAKPALRLAATKLLPDERCGDYAQGLMDIGATICAPRSPRCDICPLQGVCRAWSAGVAPEYPKKAKKAERPQRFGRIYWLERKGVDGPEVLIRARPQKGLLGGMTEFPSTEWRPGAFPEAPEYLKCAQCVLAGSHVSHAFTHFHLTLEVRYGKLIGAVPPAGCEWWPVSRLSEKPLPTLMKKVVRVILDDNG